MYLNAIFQDRGESFFVRPLLYISRPCMILDAKKTFQDPEDILRSTTEVKIMESTELLQNMHYRPMLALFFTEGTYVVFVI